MFRLIADIFRPSIVGVPGPHVDSVDDELKRYADSLNKKREDAIKRLGNKWVLHPDHYVKNQGIPANTLGFK